MRLYTLQMAKWRKAKELGIPVLDTTVKSGELTFAPSWQIVRAVKDGVSLSGIHVSPEQDYIDRYKVLMNESWRNNQARWLEVAAMPDVALMCYCKAGDFCHRILLIKYFESLCAKYGIPFEYMGEIQ